MKQSFNRTLLGALALTLIIPAVGMAQSSDTESAQALANIIAPITLTAGTPLNFGDIVASGAIGYVTVTTLGAGSAADGATLLGTTATTAATFTVGGTAGRGFTVTVPASVTMGSMTATLDPNIANGLVGTDNIAVGGTLTVAANQAEGLYTGTFNVTVSYQ